jgi:hypothetical protein
VLVLAVVCTAAAFLIFFQLVAEVGPARATVFTYVNPAVAVLLGVAFAGEHATWTILLGGLIITLGVGLVVSTERRGRAEEVSPPSPSDTARPRRGRRRSPQESRSTPGRPHRRTGVR